MAGNTGLVLGALLLLLTQLVDGPAGMSAAAWTTAGVGMLMAVWWATEAIPVPATSLLPLVLFPLFGIAGIGDVAAAYAHPVIFLLLGGFIVATALQRWNLHRRLALTILSRVGNRPQMIVAGFMGVSAFLSMWISNTATTIMMIPIALSLAQTLRGEDRGGAAPDGNITLCLILGIAYSASIGGLGTLIGTPPNAMVAAFMSETYQVEIGFLQWMALGVPIVLFLVPLAWWILTGWVFRLGPAADDRTAATVIKDELRALGALTTPQWRTALLFLLIAAAWVGRPLIQQLPGLGQLNDTIIAIAGALSLFVVRAGDRREPAARLLDWPTASQIPWGVLLLFGGGLSLAGMISASGLALWLGDMLAVLTGFHLLILLFSLVSLVIFLTELTSNTATTATLLPVLGGIAVAAQFDPVLLAAPAALAASCAFMLPVATAPNAIIYGTGEVSIGQMSRAGFVLNVFAIGAISVACYLLIPAVLM